MDRLHIINHLIAKNDYKTYGEIGVFTGYTLDGCIAESKIGIDPEINHYKGSNKVFHGTSDQYFLSLPDNDKRDIWFIDGLHEARQVTKDIENCLKHLSEKGSIVLHDVSPPKYEHTTTGIDGCWTGDTYKAAINFQERHADWYSFYCVDTDWGVGVIQKRDHERMTFLSHAQGILWGKPPYNSEWEEFDENRKGLLHLISEEEFLKKLEETNEGINNNFSAAIR